jgi:hypothetical protein
MAKTKESPPRSLAKVPKALRDEMYRALQLGESFGWMIDRLEKAGHAGYTRRDLEHFGRWGDTSL